MKHHQTILVTGGTGFIGSHTCVSLLEAGYDVLIIDNLSNSDISVVDKINQITGEKVDFIEGDIRDADLLNHIFSEHKIEAVMNFAGLKSVGESVAKPLAYYNCNVNSAITLLQSMQKAGIKQFVFSSSATVYGEPVEMPISEHCPRGKATNPYGRSKIIIEEILEDLIHAEPDWQIAILRYFNPVGAHESGLIGENPKGIPNNLLPYIAQVAQGKLAELSVFGDDYPTSDGTGVRDYIHVLDLAEGHLAALHQIQKEAGLHIWNLGTGKGYSVLEIVHAFETANQITIPYQIKPRRTGDIARCYANPGKAKQELNWQTKKSLENMLKDSYEYARKNNVK